MGVITTNRRGSFPSVRTCVQLIFGKSGVRQFSPRSDDILKISKWIKGHKSFLSTWGKVRSMGVGPLRRPLGGIGRQNRNSPPHFRENTSVSILFRLLTESKMCSSALLRSRFPPSKAPLSIGRSWVQFLLMPEWKYSFFSESFNFSDLRKNANAAGTLGSVNWHF